MAHGPITSLYAGILALIYVFLSYRVIARRNVVGAALGTGDDAALARTIRVHGNFAEYTPFGLLLLLLTEFAGYAPWLVHLFGIGLLAGRVLHAIGVSREPEDFRVRVSAMGLTLTALGAPSLLLIWAALI